MPSAVRRAYAGGSHGAAAHRGLRRGVPGMLMRSLCRAALPRAPLYSAGLWACQRRQGARHEKQEHAAAAALHEVSSRRSEEEGGDIHLLIAPAV
ncbi:hypothetical protein EYF80_056924 [Liparis tanakae]|uniref:Uncharacterized protein n=1 Tax=Liparis tanakae TaxID=230148 RepID=A0A4Z2EVU3_9TELE|nr:hypothetical protein EYF80_056924 [Liparis tanakae]